MLRRKELLKKRLESQPQNCRSEDPRGKLSNRKIHTIEYFSFTQKCQYYFLLLYTK